ncbi:MAG: CHRD domain-containing protein, partial [Planctomycetota bacterium]
NVHTAAFGGGEIRGQLTPARLPTTFGAGCLGSNGVRPQSGATGFPSVGSGMGIDLYGAVPGSPTIFAFGTNRDNLGPIPLPFELTLAGIMSPDCYVFLDPIITLVVFANGFGCATQPLNVPFNPSLRGAAAYGQWFVLDPPANPGGFVASSALSMPIQ